MFVNEVLLKNLLPLLSVNILVYSGLFLPKNSKHGSNAYYQLSMISSTKLLLQRKFWSLKIGLEWFLMKVCKKNPTFLLLLVEILIYKCFLSKTSKHGSNAYSQLYMISSPRLTIQRELWSLKVELKCLLINSYKKAPFLFY